MHHDTLQRLLDLIGKTGDRIVVTDPAGEKPYVLMSLDQYEKLIGQGEAPSAHPATPVAGEAPKPARRPTLQVAEDLDPPVDLGSSRKKREIPLWKPSPAQKPVGKAESLVVQDSAGDSEEQFYLEPLE